MNVSKLSKILFYSGLILVLNVFNIINAADKPPLLNTEQIASPQAPVAPPPPPPIPSQIGIPNEMPPPPNNIAAVPMPPPNIAVELRNVNVAVATAKSIKPFLKAGKVWCAVAADGRIDIKGAVMYKGTVVAVLHFSSLDGSVLPCGVLSVLATPKMVKDRIKEIEERFSSIVNSLELLDGAEYLMPERAWSIPIAYNKKIVGHIKVYSDGVHIVPNYHENIEMQIYER